MSTHDFGRYWTDYLPDIANEDDEDRIFRNRIQQITWENQRDVDRIYREVERREIAEEKEFDKKLRTIDERYQLGTGYYDLELQSKNFGKGYNWKGGGFHPPLRADRKQLMNKESQQKFSLSRQRQSRRRRPRTKKRKTRRRRKLSVKARSRR